MLLVCFTALPAQTFEPSRAQKQKETAFARQLEKAIQKQAAKKIKEDNKIRKGYCYYCGYKIINTGDPHRGCPAQQGKKCSETPYAQNEVSEYNYNPADRVVQNVDRLVEVTVRMRNDGKCASCGKHILDTGDPHYKCEVTKERCSQNITVKLTPEEIKQLPHCSVCGEPVVDMHQLCPATKYEKTCQPRCPDCGRTVEEIAKYGHNHKPPYKF